MVLSGEFQHPVSRMVATGVPPSAVIVSEIKALREEVARRFDTAGFAALNAQFAGFRAHVEQRFTALPVTIASEISNAVTVNGVAPVTRVVVEDRAVPAPLCPAFFLIEGACCISIAVSQRPSQAQTGALCWCPPLLFVSNAQGKAVCRARKAVCA